MLIPVGGSRILLSVTAPLAINWEIYINFSRAVLFEKTDYKLKWLLMKLSYFFPYSPPTWELQRIFTRSLLRRWKSNICGYIRGKMRFLAEFPL
jgi:hypothetical protein